jgi:hypothetical protein
MIETTYLVPTDNLNLKPSHQCPLANLQGASQEMGTMAILPLLQHKLVM